MALVPMMFALAFVRAMPKASGRATMPRIRRRVWLIAGVWLQVPWVVGPSLPWAMEQAWVHGYFGLLSATSIVSLHTPTLVMSGTGLLGIACVAVWRRSLRRLALAAGALKSDAMLRWSSWPTRVALLGLLLPQLGDWMLQGVFVLIDRGLIWLIAPAGSFGGLL